MEDDQQEVQHLSYDAGIAASGRVVSRTRYWSNVFLEIDTALLTDVVLYPVRR